jgi:polyhydroxybutyrate depolymerase
MRKTFTLAALAFAFGSQAQTITTSIQHGGLTRDFIRHVPAVYDAEQPTPLVIVLHGLGDNMQNMSQAGFHQVSDTANFIVLTPQALMDDLTQATAWNSGAGTLGIGPNLNIDDVGFISALIDSTEAQYNIDPEKIFVCGFSNGGFMTNRLACELNDRIMSFASVAGTIGGNITCNPGRAVPFCHFHGTADSNVGYDGSLFGGSVADWLTFWKTNNQCDPTEDYRHLADLFDDGYTVETYFYQGTGPDSRVLHYKVNGADHIWLGPQNDVFYTFEIWRFFMNYPLRPHATGIGQTSAIDFNIFPNPTSGDCMLMVDPKHDVNEIRVTDLRGHTVLIVAGNGSGRHEIRSTSLSAGIYTLNVVLTDGSTIKGRMVKE